MWLACGRRGLRRSLHPVFMLVLLGPCPLAFSVALTPKASRSNDFGDSLRTSRPMDQSTPAAHSEAQFVHSRTGLPSQCSSSQDFTWLLVCLNTPGVRELISTPGTLTAQLEL